MKLPPLKALPVFESVARLNSFSRAALELHVSQSAVSHQVKQLEEYLGERLFVRHGRSLELTDQGASYLEAVSSALIQIEKASQQLLGQADTRLRLAVSSSFAVRWLVPRMPLLKRLHPEIELALEMTTEEPELSDRIADCFIALGNRQRAYSYELLYVEQLFPICSRSFWQSICRDLEMSGEEPGQRDQSLTPEQVARYPLLSTHSIYGEANRDWYEWFGAAGRSVPAGTKTQQFSHMLLALEAARHDQGIALANDYMLEAAASSQQDLVRLPTHAVTTGDQFYFAYKTTRRNEPGIQVLRRWLVGQAIESGLRSSDGGRSPSALPPGHGESEEAASPRQPL